MSLLQRAVKSLGGVGLFFTLPAYVLAQPINSTNFYAPQASEYDAVGSIPGDQANPALSLTPSGGFLVWQDNITDGDGLGISAIRLDHTVSPIFGTFAVNTKTAGDQENPQVASLQGGGAAFVWQGGLVSSQHIYARFLSASNLWITPSDIEVDSSTNFFQSDPAIAALPNGNVVVVWASYGQDNADGMQGVYGQILSPTGQKIGGEFQCNQFTPYNQRTPSVGVFPNGNFIVSWISELQRSSQAIDGNGNANGGGVVGINSVDVYARVFNSTGNPGTNNEFLVNTSNNTCANPSVAIANDGSYLLAWSEKNPNPTNANNGWDIYGRSFNSVGAANSGETLINSQQFGDQFAPKASADGTNYLVVWTSMGQDGSREGVFGQFINNSGGHAGSEMQVNTFAQNQQEFPAVTSDGAGRFLVAWSSYRSVANGLDIRAQRYATTLEILPAPSAPMVLALDSFSLGLSWPVMAGFNVSYYEIFEDGSGTANIITSNMFTDFNFDPGTTHTFQLAYVLTDGTESPKSAIASGTTWGNDRSGYGVGTAGLHLPNGDGLPDDWETLYYGTNRANWPKQGGSTIIAPGVTAQDVFNWGADPTKPSTWLTQSITRTAEGFFLNWNTVPGGIYQVISAPDMTTWAPLGSPRFAAGTTDSIYLGTGGAGYYRIVRNRY